jgi:hypothetical protein
LSAASSEPASQRVELRLDRLLQIVTPPVHPVAFDPQLRRRAQHLLRVRLVRGADAGGEDRDLQPALLERLDELRQILFHSLGQHVSARTNRRFDAVKTKFRENIGRVVVIQKQQRLLERAEFPRAGFVRRRRS